MLRQALWVLTGLVLAGGAAAQEVASDDELVVTAQRRETRLVDAPASVSRLDTEQITLIDADHIAEALSAAPGVGVQRGSGAEHLTAIRSPVLTGGAGAGSFLYLENGVPIRAAGFANVNGLLDAHHEIADAIEIVRGPSAALYGANAIHGVINILSPIPSGASSVFAEISGDTQDRYKAAGSVSGRQGPHSFFAGVSAVSEAGYRVDAGLDHQKISLRHIFDGQAISVDTIFSFNNLEQETAGFIFGNATLENRDLRRTNDFPFAYRDAKSARIQSTIEARLNNKLTLRVTPYGRWHEMEFLQHFLPSNSLENNGHSSIGAQSAIYYDAGPLSLIAGADIEYTEGNLREFQEAPQIFSFTQGLHYDYDVQSVDVAGFGQAQIDLSENTTITAALRVDAMSYDYVNNAPDGIVGRFLRPADRSDNFVTVSPKFSIRHEFSLDASLYASYARGARPPQTSDLYRLQKNQGVNPAEPETIDAFEAGARLNLTSGASLSLAAYWMDKHHFFFRDADGFNVPNGRTRHIGAEAELSIDLSPNISLESALSYGRHTYRFDRITGNQFETILSGNDVDTAPRVMANTRLSWRPREGFLLGAEWVVTSGYYTDAANAHRYDGHHLLNIRVVAPVTEQLAAFATLRNAANDLYAERADFAFGSDRFFPGEERTLAFGLRYRR